MNNEHSEEISFFRSTLQGYIAPLMDALKGEYTRLEALPAQCQDEFAIKCLGKNHYKDPTPWRSPKFYGRALLDIFVFIADTKTSPGLPSTKVPTQSLLEKGQTRENNLNRLVNSLRTYVSVAPVVLVLDATFRYAERKKFYDSADLELSGIGIMTPQQIVSFLSELSSTNKKLFTAFIKKWSKRYEITLFREALIAKDLSSATEYLTGTNGGASAFAIEVSSVAKGLYKIDSFTESIQQSIKACKKIDSKYYVKRTDVLPVGFLKELEDSYYSEANHEELKVELSAKQHLFSGNEYSAIIGSETDTVNNQAEELPIPDNNSAFVFEQESTAPSGDGKLTPANRVNRPPRFSGDRGERAFQKLYNELNNVFIENTSYENFAGLFRCLPPEQEPTSYYKIRWIAPKGVRSLQYFIEALYRPTNNSHATLDKQALSRIFVIDSNKELKLSNNPLYCWGKQKPIDFNNPQEKEIMAFISIINKVLE